MYIHVLWCKESVHVTFCCSEFVYVWHVCIIIHTKGKRNVCKLNHSCRNFDCQHLLYLLSCVVAAKWGWVVDVESTIVIITINVCGVISASVQCYVWGAPRNYSHACTYCRTRTLGVCELESANHINFVSVKLWTSCPEEGIPSVELRRWKMSGATPQSTQCHVQRVLVSHRPGGNDSKKRYDDQGCSSGVIIMFDLVAPATTAEICRLQRHSLQFTKYIVRTVSVCRKLLSRYYCFIIIKNFGMDFFINGGARVAVERVCCMYVGC